MALIHTDDQKFKDVIAAAPIALVDFYADWCGPCKMLAPILEELAEEKADSLTVVKVNVDDSPETAGAFSIMSIPTVILFKDGQVVDKLVGYTTKENLIAKFGL